MRIYYPQAVRPPSGFAAAQQLVAISIDVQGDPTAMLDGIRQRLADLRPVLTDIGEEVLLPSFAQNFIAGGRPAWRFKGFQSSPPMRRTDTLFRAVTTRGAAGNIFIVTPTQLTVGVQAALPDKRRGGELRPYPIAHQIGRYPYVGFQHIFILAQPEDVKQIVDRIAGYISGAGAVSAQVKWTGKKAPKP